MSNAVGDLALTLFLAMTVVMTAVVSYYLLRRRSRPARHRVARIDKSPEYWRMKSRAVESQWTDSHTTSSGVR